MTKRTTVVANAHSAQTKHVSARSNVLKSSTREAREASAQLQEEAEAALQDVRDDISSHIESLKGKKARQQLAKQRPDEQNGSSRIIAQKHVASNGGIDERVQKSPRSGSAGKNYNAANIFREQRDAVKLTFDSAPSQWDVPPESVTPKKSTQATKQKKSVGRPRKNMFEYSDIDSEKPTPKPSAKRGRPRKSSLPPSPLGIRSSTRQQKRKIDAFADHGSNKRAKTSKTQPRPYGTRRQYMSRANQEPSPVIEETEADSDDDYNARPAADQEEELPSGDAGNQHVEEGDAEEHEEEHVEPVSSHRLRGHSSRLPAKAVPSNGPRIRGHRNREIISPIPEQSPALQPTTPPNQLDDEDEGDEEDVEEDNSNTRRATSNEINDSEMEDENGVANKVANEDVIGHGTVSDGANRRGKAHSRSTNKSQATDHDTGVQSSFDQSQRTPAKSKQAQTSRRSIDEEEEAAQQLQAEHILHYSGSRSPPDYDTGMDSNNPEADDGSESVTFLDLVYLMRMIIPVKASHREASRIVNELLQAGLQYQKLWEFEGFFNGSKPEPQKIEKASTSLRDLYGQIVVFASQLDADVDVVGDRVASRVWNDLDDSLERLKAICRDQFLSKSVARLFAYGLFSMIPLIASATRFHLSPEMVVLDDQKRSLKMLLSVCQVYDQLQFKFRAIKAERTSGSDHPIYKPAYEFRKRVVALSTYAKTMLRNVTRQETDAERMKNQEQVNQTLAEAARRQASFQATGFDAKKKRLILLWNIRQKKESDPYRRHILGSAGINEYLKSVKPSGHVAPSATFDASQDAWSDQEIGCLANLLKKHYMEGPEKAWQSIIHAACGYSGVLRKRPMDQLLNYAKLLKLSELDHESSEDFWTQIPDLDLCELLPIRLIVAEEYSLEEN